MRKRSGFTLVELLIVIVLIGIFAAIAIPRFTTNQRTAYTMVRKIVSDLRYTRSLAISSGERYYLHFTNLVDGSYRQYDIYKISSPSNIHIGDTRFIPANVRCTVITEPADDKFTFNYLGECNNGNGTDRIELNDGIETTRVIVIDLTGRAYY
jgi:prepilin-type N-terminal cleavage/methylation domain-containing protein